jgi:8-oxo-dGTP pyrophosphatase MutT (NUDIX family)
LRTALGGPSDLKWSAPAFGVRSKPRPLGSEASREGNRKMIDTLLIRMVLQPYWRLTRSQTLGVQGIIIKGENEVLLVRHSYVRGWHLPGGGVERHENLEQALRRELSEEAGIEIRGRPRLHGIFSNFARSTADHVAVYVVPNWKRVCDPASRHEIIERNFFGLDKVPDGLIEGAKRRLAEVFDQQPISDTW